MPFSFLLVFPSLPRFMKKDVDECNISPDAAALCDAIRAVFFLSRSIRKERTLWLSFVADRALVKMEGKTLRYLGPDERSTLMLVDKAAEALKANPQGWIESTPGTSCRAGIDPAGALALIASEQPRSALVAPSFATRDPRQQPAIAFSPGLPVLAAERGVVLVMALDGGPVPGIAGKSPPSSHPGELINVGVDLCTGSPALATRILAINLIDDCMKGNHA